MLKEIKLVSNTDLKDEFCNHNYVSLQFVIISFKSFQYVFNFVYDTHNAAYVKRKTYSIEKGFVQKLLL